MLVEHEPKYCTSILCINEDSNLCSGYIKHGARGISAGFLKKMQSLEKSITKCLQLVKEAMNINIQLPEPAENDSWL